MWYGRNIAEINDLSTPKIFESTTSIPLREEDIVVALLTMDHLDEEYNGDVDQKTSSKEKQKLFSLRFFLEDSSDDDALPKKRDTVCHNRDW